MKEPAKSARSAKRQLRELAALPQTPERTEQMQRLQGLIEKAEMRVSPLIVQGPDEGGGSFMRTADGGWTGVAAHENPADILSGPEAPDVRLVEGILASHSLALLRWLLDADGRGSFNPEAIALRVAAFIWHLDPAILLGVSERKLASELGACAVQMSRAVTRVREDLKAMGAKSTELKKAAAISTGSISSVTRRSGPLDVSRSKLIGTRKAA